ncbi:uncharacterized protein Z518_11068 [Rhinocladiella mackenziei CBS 650.93]|uniref:Rhinocladiella mackenziei CBS 650.93 unplaced genomic scaffold supercont1.11, whole genome shotgun sequence n=1 Tax=Rhinocladiella mackenziei CBS 650.93 TaxID=1442369 RepID=A0A0D2I8T8_9EURO|nr:uncharacterized protein Z518_11068 [Rhinocladiella mackenziei CBS 650.93]KIW99655.1 hypothetical protein Z518_11068 [Rhinocladiella mackenziei CBS 650.93]
MEIKGAVPQSEDHSDLIQHVNKMKIACILNDQSNDQNNDGSSSPTSIDMRHAYILKSEDNGSSSSPYSPSPTDDGAISQNTRRKIKHRIIRRRAQKKYGDERAYWIWYNRIDLNRSWDILTNDYCHVWNEKREKGGLQCKFYRLLGEHRILKVRKQMAKKRKGYPVERFGMVERTNLRFPWMLDRHRQQPPLADVGNLT